MGFCSDGFINTSELYTEAFRPSSCFQFTVLALPGLFLLLATPFTLCTKNESVLAWQRKSSARLKIKLALSSLLFLCAFTRLGKSLALDLYDETESVEMLEYVSVFGNMFAIVLFMWMTKRQQRLGQIRSHILFIYILLLFLTSFISIWKMCAEAAYSPSVVTMWAKRIEYVADCSFVLVAFLLLIAHCFAPYRGISTRLKDEKACPELSATVPSFWLFSWLSGTVWNAYRGRIEHPEDVFHVRPEDAVKTNYEKFMKCWDELKKSLYDQSLPHKIASIDIKQNKANSHVEEIDPTANGISQVLSSDGLSGDRNTPNARAQADIESQGKSKFSIEENLSARNGLALGWALMRTFGGRLAVAALFLVVGDVFAYLQPPLLGFLLQFLASKDAPSWHGYVIAVGMFGSSLMQALLKQRGVYNCLTLGVAVKSTLTSGIYRKALRLSSGSRTRYTTGRMTNVVSADVGRVMDMFRHCDEVEG